MNVTKLKKKSTNLQKSQLPIHVLLLFPILSQNVMIYLVTFSLNIQNIHLTRAVYMHGLLLGIW